MSRLQAYKTYSPRHRASQDDADELEAICVRDMEHEKAGILRRNIRNILSDEQHCLHVRYMQTERVELLPSLHQTESVKECLIKLGHSIVKDCSIVGMQVRRGGSSEE